MFNTQSGLFTGNDFKGTSPLQYVGPTQSGSVTIDGGEFIAKYVPVLEEILADEAAFIRFKTPLGKFEFLNALTINVPYMFMGNVQGNLNLYNSDTTVGGATVDGGLSKGTIDFGWRHYTLTHQRGSYYTLNNLTDMQEGGIIWKNVLPAFEREVVAREFDVYFTSDCFKFSVGAIQGKNLDILKGTNSANSPIAFDPAGTDRASKAIFANQKTPTDNFEKYVYPTTGEVYQGEALDGRTGTVLQLKSIVDIGSQAGEVIYNLLDAGIPTYSTQMRRKFRGPSGSATFYMVPFLYDALKKAPNISIARIPFATGPVNSTEFSNEVEGIATRVGNIAIQVVSSDFMAALINDQTPGTISVTTPLLGLIILNDQAPQALEPMRIVKFVSSEANQNGFANKLLLGSYFGTIVEWANSADIITLIQAPAKADQATYDAELLALTQWLYGQTIVAASGSPLAAPLIAEVKAYTGAKTVIDIDNIASVLTTPTNAATVTSPTAFQSNFTIPVLSGKSADARPQIGIISNYKNA